MGILSNQRVEPLSIARGFLLDPSTVHLSGGGRRPQDLGRLKMSPILRAFAMGLLWKVRGASQGTCITLWKVDVLWDASQADCPSSASSSLIQHFLSERKHSLVITGLRACAE